MKNPTSPEFTKIHNVANAPDLMLKYAAYLEAHPGSAIEELVPVENELGERSYERRIISS